MMLGTIFSFIAGPLIDKIIAPITNLFQAYINKQITEAQLREQLQAILLQSAKEIEIAHADDLAKTYASFMDTLKTSMLMQHVWTVAVISQLFVLVWSQFFVPLLFAFNYLPNWKAGATAEWAYLLVGALLGMGPMVLRAGPGAGSLPERLRALIGK